MELLTSIDLSNATSEEAYLAIIKGILGDSKINIKFAMAWCYAHGHTIRQNARRAFYWMEQAAQENDPFAIQQLIGYYATGYGVEKNVGKAREWVEKSQLSIEDYEPTPEQFAKANKRYYDYHNDPRVILKYTRTKEQVAATPEMNKEAVSALFNYAFNKPKEPTDFVESVVPKKPKKFEN
jgi:hypothetical protein